MSTAIPDGWTPSDDGLPTHNDGVRVILAEEDGWMTHGLASRVSLPTDEPLLDGWKLWYYTPRADLSRFTVIAWRELEKLNK